MSPNAPARLARACLLGEIAGASIGVVGAAYLAVLGAWLLLSGTPSEPIGDPYLLCMEGLTILSALSLAGLVLAVFRLSYPRHPSTACAALLTGSAAALTTVAVHFVQLTAVRALWRAGEIADYRLVWPSALFAVEYLAWDVLVGATLLLVSAALVGAALGRWGHGALRLGGVLCLLGALGPVTGHMALQIVGLVGYGVILPIAAVALAVFFRRRRAEEAQPTKG